MNDALHPDLAEAARLTRAGRLNEAIALIQRMLSGPASAAPAAASGQAGEPRTIDLSADHVELAGGAPPHATPHAPEALRDLLRARPIRGMKPGTAGWAPPTAPLGPEVVPPGGRFERRVYADETGSRVYKLYVPGTYTGEPMPLVVMLHGCSQSPDDFAAGTRMNLLAEAYGCLVCYPEQSSSANAQKCWNWFSPADQARGRGEPSLIAGIVREIMRSHAIERRRVYVAGLSAGGASAAIMAAAYPDLFAAVGVHSGLACGAASDLPSAFAAMRDGATAPLGLGRFVPTIVFHGERDTTVHPRNGEQVASGCVSALPAGLQIRSERGRVPGGHAYRRTVHAEASGRALLEQWVVDGLGHAWSGGSPAGSYADPQGPDASREMLRFFLEHSLA
jgi:poly(hydroxyalkanoate) depolymerase family esterase